MIRNRVLTAAGVLAVATVCVSGVQANAAGKPAPAPKKATATPTATATATAAPVTSTTTAPVSSVTAAPTSTASEAPVATTTAAPVVTETAAPVPATDAQVETVVEPAAVTAPVAQVVDPVTTAIEATATSLLTKPVLVNPVRRTLSPSSPGITLDNGTDYIVTVPAGSVFTSGAVILGGRNVVLENATLAYAPPAGAPAGWLVRGLYLKGQTGTMYVNGLRITGPLTEGIDLDQRAPGATVVLRNIAIDVITGTYETNHADLLQTWAGPDKLVVDGFTGKSDYQGFMLKPNDEWAAGPKPSFFSLRNVDIDVTTGYYALWTNGYGAFPITTTNVNVKPNPATPSRNAWLWPKPSTGDTTWTSVLGLF